MTHPSFPLPDFTTPDDVVYRTADRVPYVDGDERALSHRRTVFRVVRDRASFEQSLRFLEMLPLPLKVIFLNDWHITPHAPDPIHSLDEWAEAVQRAERRYPLRSRAEARRAVRAVVEALHAQVDSDRLYDSLSFVSPELRDQLLGSRSNGYHYHDTCIWLS